MQSYDGLPGSCVDCKHFIEFGFAYDWGYIDPDVVEEPIGCAARPGMANLKSFPFMVTSCRDFTPKQNPGAEEE